MDEPNAEVKRLFQPKMNTRLCIQVSILLCIWAQQEVQKKNSKHYKPNKSSKVARKCRYMKNK